MGLGDIYNNVPQSFAGNSANQINSAFQQAPGLYSQFQQQRQANESRMAPENIRGDFANAITRVMNGEDPAAVAREHKAQNGGGGGMGMPRPMMGAQEAASQAPMMPPQGATQNLGQSPQPSYGPATSQSAGLSMPETSIFRDPMPGGDDGAMRKPLPASNAFAMQRNPDYGPSGMPTPGPASRGMMTPQSPAEWDLALKMAPYATKERVSANKPNNTYDRFELERLKAELKGGLQNDEQDFKGGQGDKERGLKEAKQKADEEYRGKHLKYLWASMKTRNDLLEKRIEQGGIEDKLLIAKIGALSKVLASDIPAGMHPDQVTEFIDELSTDIDKAEKAAAKAPAKSSKTVTVKKSSSTKPTYKIGETYVISGKKRRVTEIEPDGTLLTIPVP